MSPSGGEGPARISKQAVVDAFSHVFLHDFGVCIYVFALVASFYWSYQGVLMAHSNDLTCNPGSWISRAAAFEMLFIWFVVMYAIAWFCYMQCMSAGEGLVLRRTPVARAQYHEPGAAAARMDQGATTAYARPVGDGSTDIAADTGEPRGLTVMRNALSGRSLAKLLACIGLDMMGNASYFLPAIGEAGDAAYAPAQAVMLKMLFDSNAIAVLGLVEELLPFTDALPTATIAWFLENCLPDHPLTRVLGLGSDRTAPPAPDTAP